MPEREAAKHLATLEARMGDALNMVAMPDDPVSAEYFVRAAQRPAPRPEISGDSIPAVEEEPSTEWSVANWLTSIRAVSAHLADSLVGDDRAARRSELAAMAALADGDDAAVVSRLRARLSAGTDELARLLLPRVRELAAAVAAGAATGEALQSKFCESGAFTLQHLTLADFFKGLEGRIGAPTPGSVSTVLESMRGEHTTGTSQGVEPHEPFLTANYGVCTTSALEWRFVAEPDAPPQDGGWPAESKPTVEIEGESRDVGRRAMPLAELEQLMRGKNAQLESAGEPPLIIPEVVGARLYTGPLFFKYNGVLRGWNSPTPLLRNEMIRLCCPQTAFDAYIGDARGTLYKEASGTLAFAEAQQLVNPYTTTLHVINSAIIKLGKLTRACRVYRGVSGGVLPREFLVPNAMNLRGGVEPGFMSTSQERDVAVGYSQGKAQAKMVIQIDQGMTSRGADISWLSQYPHEREILFGPLTALETSATRADGATLVVSMRVSVNLASLTIERVVGKMKDSHLALLRMLMATGQLSDCASAEYAAAAALQPQPLTQPSTKPPASPTAFGRYRKLDKAAQKLPDDYFNSAEEFKLRTNMALDVKGRLEFDSLYDEFASKKHFTFFYGNLKAYYGGLTALLEAPPGADALEEMRREHTEGADADVPFSQWQQEAGGTVHSSSRVEWYFVTDPTDARRATLTLDGRPLAAWPVEVDLVPGGGSGSRPRTPRPLADFEPARAEVNAKLAALGLPELTPAMLVAIRLYLGTMGKNKYNVALRAKAGMPGFEKGLEERNRGNTYVQTLHTISAAVKSLAKIAQSVPVWRGVAGGLPEKSFLFFDAKQSRISHSLLTHLDKHGIRGGVEICAAGCSPKEAVSVKWGTSADVGVVFEIQAGVQRGAETGAFGDYPEISEITYPPCTFMQVTGVRVKRNFVVGTTDGTPKEEQYVHQGKVLYIDVMPHYH